MLGTIKAGVVSALTVLLAVSPVAARQLSLDERVTAQKAIEQVYWNHRIWPKENPSPKPALSAFLSDLAIRAKVDDYLRKSNALETFWHRPITAAQLQAELDRIASNTRDGSTLQELFGALGNDPFVIAETLGRQTLVDRLIRDWYSSDTRFHGALKAKIEAALATCVSIDCMKTLGGFYSKATLKRRAGRSDAAAKRDGDSILLEADEWAEQLGHLASKLNATVESLPTGRWGGLDETEESFVVTAVLEQRKDELVTASVSWPKRPFGAWWNAERTGVGPGIALPAGTFALPSAPSTTCTNDTWTPTRFEAPDPRWGHTAVWTGSEMIVWGGGSAGAYKPPRNSGGRYNPSTDTWTTTSTGTAVPTPRESHTAVWTGTEMIVWGGFATDDVPFPNSTVYFNTGGRYSPATNSWTPTSTGAGVPPARHSHTAVWTGTEMIVWGGQNAFNTNTGGRYNPSTNSWATTSTGAGDPSARRHHSAVWTGTEMIVWGGLDSSYSNTGGRYNPSTNSWATTSIGAGVPSVRALHSAVWTGTEMIVWGGSNNTCINTGGRYNPVNDSWAATSTGANVPSGRSGHTAVWTGNQSIVWGGVICGNSSNTGGRYSPSTDSWEATSTGPNAPADGYRSSAVWTGTEMIIWGGGESAPNRGARYLPAGDSWTTMSSGASVTSARDSQIAVWTGAEMIVWGGYDGGFEYVNSGGRYNPATDAWTATSTGANVPAPIQFRSAVWTGTEMIVWGGTDGSTGFNTGGRYNPATDGWMATSVGTSVPTARYLHTAVWTGTEMIVWGGYDTSNTNTGGRYDPSTNSWTATSVGANVPTARSAHTAVWTGTEMIVWGGYLNTGGRYNPLTNGWTATSTGTDVPTSRGNHTAVWTGTEMLIWGGYSASYLSTGGRYKPSTDTWAPISTEVSAASGRDRHSAVWTGTEMIVWGGYDGTSTLLRTGGRYSPSIDHWVPTSTGENVPTGRFDHSAVWTGSQMIVWGGRPMTASGGAYCACPDGRTYFRDADGDGYGNPGVSTSSCDGVLPTGYVADSADCNDLNAAIHPGAAELCNGLDDNCDNDGPASETDADGDGVRVCAGDCDDANVLRYPHAPEVNDGIDNQCPGDAGYGAIDELSGVSGYFTSSDDTISWPAQIGATSYENVRSSFADFHAGCVHNTTASLSWSDPATPLPAGVFYYLVRALAPRSGSWGQRRPAVERTVCAGCTATGDWCDDGSTCTVGDACVNSVCNPGAPLSCDDANPCTDDSCNPASGCAHVNNTATCSDGTACTTGDVCGGGTCHGGSSLNCDDANLCTDDSCNPASGCVHTNNATACDDGNTCTTGDICSGGVCTGTLPPVANHLVISQIQASGDGSNPPDDEFVELYNPTASAVSLTNWSLQTPGSLGGFTVLTLAGSIPAHGWYLVARSGYNGSAARDQFNNAFGLTSAGESILLVNTTSQVPSCSAGSIVDKVAYGSGTCPEGGTGPALSANNSMLRKPGGACGNGTDTNLNAQDFVTQVPSTPRNSASPPQP